MREPQDEGTSNRPVYISPWTVYHETVFDDRYLRDRVDCLWQARTLFQSAYYLSLLDASIL